MAAAKPRVKLPSKASAGEVIRIQTIITHVMETGLSKDKDGKPIPRSIINRFECEFNGQPVFSCDIEPAVSANPYFEFNAKVSESGKFKFTWHDDDGSVYTHEEAITVS
jgi:sulfur-oxidizing protein SoxZ